jgi:hypothetical protein
MTPEEMEDAGREEAVNLIVALLVVDRAEQEEDSGALPRFIRENIESLVETSLIAELAEHCGQEAAEAFRSGLKDRAEAILSRAENVIARIDHLRNSEGNSETTE